MELIQLNGELVYLLKLDEQIISNDLNLRYIQLNNSMIDVVRDITDVINLLQKELCVENTLAALLQLIKIGHSPILSSISHLKSASFYEDWHKSGYINELYNCIKLKY